MIPYKYIFILLAALGLFAGGFYVGRGQKQVEIREVKTKGETITRTVDHIITVEKTVHPDGTVTERTITEDRNVDEKQKEKSTDKGTSITPNSSQYSLGVRYWVPVSSRAFDPKTYDINQLEVSIGRKLIGDIWVEGGYKLNNEVSIGLRLQF